MAIERSPPVSTNSVLRLLGRVKWSGIVLWFVLLALIIIPVSVFILAGFSPRLFHLGDQWFTLSYVNEAFSGYTGQGIINSLWVSTTVGILAVSIATTLAWLVQRTTMFGGKVLGAFMWVLLLIPTWMMTVGWTNFLQPGELATALGFDTTTLYNVFYGPCGIILILTTAALPFCYFVISAGLRGLGSEFEDAARVHGSGTARMLHTVLPIIAPALLSAFAIAFAESISDFGVAFTLGAGTHFPMATFTLYGAISENPANFSVAAIIALVLILCTVPPILMQARVTRGRSYAVLGARTRSVRRHAFKPAMRIAVSAGVFLVVGALLILPLAAAVLTSFTRTISFYTPTGIHWSLDSYRQIFNPPPSIQPLGSALWTSNQLGFYVASLTVILAYVLARRLAARNAGWSQRLADVFLLGSVAIPGVVLGVGYILFYNQAFLTRHGINLYQTWPLLIMGLIASATPGQSRLLVGPVSQIQSSLSEAARVHGASRARTWRTTSLPILSRTMTWAWILTFTKTIAELAVVQMLVVPGREPVSVVIETTLGTVFAPIGTAATVVVLAEMLGVIVIALLAYRIVSPRGWRRIGEMSTVS